MRSPSGQNLTKTPAFQTKFSSFSQKAALSKYFREILLPWGDDMGKISPKSSYKNLKNAAKTNRFLAARQSAKRQRQK